jgi:hypothetical protein
MIKNAYYNFYTPSPATGEILFEKNNNLAIRKERTCVMIAKRYKE